ncbi:LamG domain-containing protein [Uliginosibacterium sp. H3]|uniref:LamG domain-containing protein n=1 Tax=Uliginosibacterium silvisoli TaxID=3114758 RepID=A0ABU6K2T3_9RHOO|nr:LamG domain-containing protein [Uliginosibacterium sp. H3]
MFAEFMNRHSRGACPGLFLPLAFALCLSACGGGGDSPSAGSDTSTNVSSSSKSSTASSAASSAASSTTSTSSVAVPDPALAYSFDSTATTDFKTITPYFGGTNMTAASAANVSVFSFAANKAGAASTATRITPTASVDDYYRIVAASVPAPLKTPAAITLEAMIQFSSVTTSSNIVLAKHMDTGNTQGFNLYVKTGGGSLGFRINNGAAYEQPVTLATDGSWTHIVATYDGANMHLYVNGVELGTGVAQTGALLDSSTDFQVGGNSTSNPNAAVNGVLDDLRIYNVGLTLEQVQARYAAY